MLSTALTLSQLSGQPQRQMTSSHQVGGKGERRKGGIRQSDRSELGETCEEPLREGQFRLAIGFKFMKSSESSPVTRYLVNGPSATLRRHIRGLKLPPNRPLPDIYRMDEVDMAQDKPGPFSRAVGVPMGAKLGRFIAPEK